MQTHPTRRALLKAGAAATALPLLPALAQERRFEPQVAGWRTFEVTTQCDVADVKGATRLWLPVPDLEQRIPTIARQHLGRQRHVGAARGRPQEQRAHAVRRITPRASARRRWR